MGVSVFFERSSCKRLQNLLHFRCKRLQFLLHLPQALAERGQPDVGATLRDIARKAGVSDSTVSRALAGSPLVNRETRERIRRLAAEAGYRPNHLARSLALGRSNTLGVIINSLAEPLLGEVADALYGAARDRGYEVLITPTQGRRDLADQQVERLIGHRVDGVIVWGGPARGKAPYMMRLFEQRLPYVVLGSQIPDDETSYIAVDRAIGMEQAVAHLVATGRTRLGYVGVDVMEGLAPTPNLKYPGFLAALQRRGLAPALGLHCRPQRTAPGAAQEAGYEAGRRLAENADLPEAILCSGDLMALGLMVGLRHGGVRVPRDIAVIGHDGITDGRFSTPQLTTIAQPILRMAELGVETILGLFEETDAPPRREMLEPRLVVRESCGCGGSMVDG